MVEVVAALADDVPCGAVNSADGIYADPHVAARGMLVQVEQPGSGTPVTVAGQPIKLAGVRQEFHRAPRLGEHTAEILSTVDGL
jgi:crotonobetainyl-CoA:carnitine CoA-transferase CaiB-like acyl-CoA transferase